MALTGGDFAEQARICVRADRHARSLPLLVVGLSLGILAVIAGASQSPILPMIVPAVAFLVLFTVMKVQRTFKGVGVGRDGYGIAVAVAVIMPLLIPMMAFVTGPVIILGLGLVIVGWRGGDAHLWVTGLVLTALSPPLVLGTFVNHAGFLGATPKAVVIWAITVAVVALGVFWFAREGAAPQQPLKA